MQRIEAFAYAHCAVGTEYPQHFIKTVYKKDFNTDEIGLF
jgi:hypothetical protein